MLYKYVTFDRKDILENRLIRFTQPGCFNDPFEMHPSFDLMSKADLAALPDAPHQEGVEAPKMKLLTPEALNAMFTALMPGIQRAIRATVAGQGACALDNNLIARSVFDEKYGIFCLTDLPNNLLMWAHYANSHKGLVIQFDETHEFFQTTATDNPETGLRKVEYSNQRPVLSYSTIESPAIFYRKSTDWSYENEWRFIKPLAQATKVIDAPIYPLHLFSLPVSAITGVILGATMPHEHSQQIFEICSRSELQHVTIYQVQLNDITFQLDIHPPLDGKVDPSALAGRVRSAR